MRLMAVTFVAHSQHVVRLTGHRKVVGADDTLIVV